MAYILRFLKFASKSPNQYIIQVLSKNRKIVNLVCEILLNILLKNIKVDRRIINKLRKYKRIIYRLVDKHTHIRERRQLLQKTWPILKILSPIIPTVIKSLKNAQLLKNVLGHGR
jgi:hypothetical protein